jgi:hypothetical protein
LARCTALLAARKDESVAALEKSWRAGTLSATELQTQLLLIAKQEPEAALSWVDGSDLEAHLKSQVRTWIIREWFPKDPDAAIARASIYPYPDASAMAGGLIALLQTGIPEEKAAVVRHLDEIVAMTGDFPVSSASLFPSCSTESGDALLALPPGRGRDALVRHFATAWLQQDPTGAAAWLGGAPVSLRDAAMEQYASEALHPRGSESEVARKLATQWLLKDASSSARARLGPLFAESMARDDPAAAMAWAAKNLTAGPLAEASSKVVGELASRDPDAARALVEGLPPGTLKNQAARQVAAVWLASDPIAAISWYLAKTNPRLADRLAARALGREWAEGNPGSFRNFLADPASPELPETLLSPGIQRMMESNRSACLEWISSLPTKRRNSALKSAYESWARESPADAAASLDDRPDLATPDAARQIAVTWYQRDPQRAVGWVADLPWGGQREAAIAGLKRHADFEVELGGKFPDELKALIR